MSLYPLICNLGKEPGTEKRVDIAVETSHPRKLSRCDSLTRQVYLEPIAKI